ncbi:hypothetical protein A3860_31460 [Niastella vici]|uniref:Uncharacterized protein n=1 Tax=Niastella vici TaxID=1703345 RepID=A0A1V9FTX5_9BACT|nr:hypothetical protein [Niastella vici]OQP61780.1 hypothetical protein A3860_31460 [Niastella vici]
MRILLLIGTLIIFLKAQSQDKYYDTYTVDTITLTDIHFKKVVSYQINSVTFFVNYEDYKNELYICWKRYHDGMKGTKREKRRGEYINPDYEPRWKIIDSVYQLLKKQVTTQDTIFLTQKIFDKVGLGALNSFFPDMIEKNNCAIFGSDNKRHFIIIRHKGSKKTGNFTGTGGRVYFLPGQKKYFIGAMDWVS